MSTIWKATMKGNHDSFTGAPVSSWSRQQKLAMTAGFAILGVLLAVSACSRQSQKSAQVSVSSPVANSPGASASMAQTPAPQTATPLTPAVQTAAKKTPKKRAANVSYTDANSGVSFVYPRKFALATGEKAQHQLEEMPCP